MSFYQFDPSSATPVYKSQLCFHGVARFPLPRTKIGYQGNFKPKSNSIATQLIVDTAYPTGGTGGYASAPVSSIYSTITDWDFELYQIKIGYAHNGVPLDPTVPHAYIRWFDSLKNATSNIPVLDQYWNGAPGSRYEMGAVVPPVLFPTQSQLHMDFYTLFTAAQLPVVVSVEWVGKQRIPC